MFCASQGKLMMNSNSSDALSERFIVSFFVHMTGFPTSDAL